MLQGAERKLEKTVTTPGETKGETPKRNKRKRWNDERKVREKGEKLEVKKGAEV
jgi:hypothetical protein